MKLEHTISRRLLAESLRSEVFVEYVGTMGYDSRPFYCVGRATVPAPVQTSVEFASRHQDNDNYVEDAGDLLRWLDDVPRDTVMFWPDYAGYKQTGYWQYYKDSHSQWHFCGYESFSYAV